MKTVALAPDAQAKVEPVIPQAPLEVLRVKPEPDAVAVKVAQVPPTYHVPAEIKQPVVLPALTTLRVPAPAKEEPVGAVPEEVVVAGGVVDVGVVVEVGATEEVLFETGEPVLGTYLMPVAGQLEEPPTRFLLDM